MESMKIRGGDRACYVYLSICQILKILWDVNFFVNKGSYGAGNLKMLCSYHFQPNLMTSLITMVEYSLLLFLVIGQVLKNCDT